MNRVTYIALAAVGIMSLIAAMFAPRPGDAPARPVAAANTKSIDVGKALTLSRDGSGQFTLRVDVNGSEVEFLVDTGADVVALTIETAEAARLPVDPASFEPMMQTASGTGNGARYMVDEFRVAGREFRDVEVVVLEGLQTNLLGQSMLKKLGRVELKGDRMVIGHD